MLSAEAIVARRLNDLPERLSIELAPPADHEVLVDLVAAGVCHSDASLTTGVLRQPLPAVLGHEGSGTVTAVGPAVTTVTVGDPVVFSWSPPCGRCWFCRRHQPWLCAHASEPGDRIYAHGSDGTELRPGLGVGSFATRTVVPENAVLPVPTDIPLRLAALVGCAVMTSFGAVRNVARVRPGDSVAVLGLGGVGLAAVAAARIAGATMIIGIDPSAAAADVARSCGATTVIGEPGGGAIVPAVRELTDGLGVDHAIEAVGRAETIRQAYSLTRRGGQTTVVGMGARDDAVTLSALEIPFNAKVLAGCYYGNSDPRRDLPAIWADIRSGRLDLSQLVGTQIGLSDVPSAIADLLSGRGRGRALVGF